MRIPTKDHDDHNYHDDHDKIGLLVLLEMLAGLAGWEGLEEFKGLTGLAKKAIFCDVLPVAMFNHHLGSAGTTSILTPIHPQPASYN